MKGKGWESSRTSLRTGPRSPLSQSGGPEFSSPEDFGGGTGYRSPPAPGSGPPERGRPTGIAEQLDDDIPF